MRKLYLSKNDRSFKKKCLEEVKLTKLRVKK